METIEDKVFYQDQNVTITKSRITANGRTYAMRNISSVMLFHKSKSRVFEIILLIIGSICLIGKTWGLGFFLIAFAVLLFTLRRDIYSVRISSNSGEADGLESSSRQYISKIVDAVNEAIVFRG